MESLHTPAGFREQYRKNLKGRTPKQAYELTEEQHTKKYEHAKYKTYESFRSLLSRAASNKRDKVNNLITA
jgi:hypothetical protein